MTETKIYVGLNDGATRRQEQRTETYVDVMRFVCQSYRVAFSFCVTEGGYFHADGTFAQEHSLVLTLVDADRRVVDAIARDLCAFFHQESVMVTEGRVRAYTVSEALGAPVVE